MEHIPYDDNKHFTHQTPEPRREPNVTNSNGNSPEQHEPTTRIDDGRQNPTITAVVIPAHNDLPSTRRQIGRGYRAGQQIVGGLIQPVDMPSVEATIWVNEEGLLLGLPFNERATRFLWNAQPEHIGYTALVGDAYVTGLPDDEGEITNVPEAVLEILVRP